MPCSTCTHIDKLDGGRERKNTSPSHVREPPVSAGTSGVGSAARDQKAVRAGPCRPGPNERDGAEPARLVESSGHGKRRRLSTEQAVVRPRHGSPIHEDGEEYVRPLPPNPPQKPQMYRSRRVPSEQHPVMDVSADITSCRGYASGAQATRDLDERPGCLRLARSGPLETGENPTSSLGLRRHPDIYFRSRCP